MKNVEIKDKEDDFNKKVTESKLENYEFNFLFYLMIITTVLGTILIIFRINEFMEPLRQINPNYELPSIYDFKITLIAVPIISVNKC